jgi:hypothetical protein
LSVVVAAEVTALAGICFCDGNGCVWNGSACGIGNGSHDRRFLRKHWGGEYSDENEKHCC